MAEITIFEQYKPFFRDHYRFNVSYGGRGRGATWNIARGLLAESLTEKHRILCTREFQNSISESVYEVIVSQIALLGLDKYFNIQKTSIESVNGSEFIFKGLRHNVDSIKSMEGITRCWIAEADKVPQDSLDKLIPTVRTEGSKFYIDFNTDSVDDPIYKMLVESPRADTFVLFQTYADNKFFPEVLRSDLEHDKANDYEKYLWIWEGQPRAFSDACVFKGRYIVDDFKTPDDVEFLHGIDWGFAKDPTVAVRCFIKDDRLWVDQSVGGVGVDIDELSEMFDRIPTLRRWVSYADSSRPETISYMRKKGFPNMRPSLKGKGSVEDGIELLKGFEKIVIHPRCEGLIEEMKLYRYKVNSLTGDVMPVLEDKNNHYIDALRYSLGNLVRKHAIRTLDRGALGL